MGHRRDGTLVMERRGVDEQGERKRKKHNRNVLSEEQFLKSNLEFFRVIRFFLIITLVGKRRQSERKEKEEKRDRSLIALML